MALELPTEAETKRIGIVDIVDARAESHAVVEVVARTELDAGVAAGLVQVHVLQASLELERLAETAANAALKTPVLTVVAQFADDKKTEQVTFARAGTDVVASRSDEPGTAKVEAAGFDETLKALDAVK